MIYRYILSFLRKINESSKSNVKLKNQVNQIDQSKVIDAILQRVQIHWGERARPY